MYNISALVFISLLATSSFAQNKASIKGTLVDSISKAPLEYATIAVVNAKDTTLISYTLSDKKGYFILSGLPAGKPAKMIISYVGYHTLRQNLDFSQGLVKDFGTISLNGQSLQEVVIRGEKSPVVIKKDTIEFNTEAFKTRPNAVVEELLRKLPGVQVNMDGSILVNGKSISKLTIDGKEFFGSDPKVATRNLDADMIDKIQVFEDRENDPDHKISADEVNKIINLTLKNKVKTSTIGKMYAGGGSRDRYETGGIISNFRDTLQVSLIGLANNLTKTGFSREDLNDMGGFGRSGGSQTYDGTFGGQSWGGMEKVASAGFNVNNDYGKRLKLNLVYFYTNTNTVNRQNGFNERTLTDTILSSSSSYNSDRTENKHTVGGLVDWRPDTATRFRYEPKLNLTANENLNSSLSNSFNNFNPRLNETNRNETKSANSNSFSHNFSYHRRLKKKGRSFNINHGLSLNNNTSDEFSYNNFTSFTSGLKSEVLDRFADYYTQTNSGNVSLNYNFPIVKKLAAEITADSKYASSTDFLKTFDKNTQTGIYDLFLPNQSNELNRKTFMQSIRTQVNYQLNKKYSVRLGLIAEYQDVKNQFNSSVSDISQKYYNFFPSLQLRGPGFSVNYSQRLELPSISQMQPIVRQYSQLYTHIGNPDLKAGRIYQFSGNLYKYDHSKQFNYNAYTSITLSENNIVQKATIDGNGATTSTFVNRNGGMRASFSGNAGKQLKKSQNWQIGLNTNFYSYIRKGAFFLNADEGVQYNYDLGAGQGINFNYHELLSINSSYNFTKSITAYKEVVYRTVNTNVHTLSADLSLRWPKKVIIDSRYSFNYNPQVAQGFSKSSNILNLSVTLQMLKKDRGQLKLSVYDLLDENISVSRYAYNNAVSINQQEVLKRYVLLTYQYKLNIFKSK